MLFEEGIPFLYYFGDLDQKQRQAAIDAFQTNPTVKVLVSSLPPTTPTPIVSSPPC